ncbi:hypothetical protein D3C71_186930 [compost metagenome]
MCRSSANQTHFVQTVVSDFIDRANDFINAGFIRPFVATCTVRIDYNDSHLGMVLENGCILNHLDEHKYTSDLSAA